MNCRNTPSSPVSCSSPDVAIDDRSMTVPATRIRASQRTASAMASDARESISTSRWPTCRNTLPWKTLPPLPAVSVTRSFTTTRVISTPLALSIDIIRSCVSGRSLGMPAMRVAMLWA